MSETTPLLQTELPLATYNVYERFSRAQKRVILTIVSNAGLLALFISECFVPCVPNIARDLNTSGTVINYTIGTFMVTLVIGNLVCAPYADFYGRRAVYLVFLPILCLGCLSASVSVNIIQFAVSRAFQGFGASCLIPVGAAVVSDMYQLEERGTAMGVFFGIVLLGPALAPIIGGIAATYASWRVMQLILFAVGFISFISIAACLPETSHPGTRGIDKATPELEESPSRPGIKRRWHWVWLNPLKSATELLRSPNFFLVALSSSLVLMTFFVLGIPLPYTLGPRYGVTNPTHLGLCLLTSGAGSIVGATLGGRLSDRAVVNGIQKRGGIWVPEDRLKATMFGAWVLVPLSVLIFGLTIQFVPGRLGLVISLICLFVNGVGIDIVLSPTNTYSADILHHRGAEVMGVLNAFHCVPGAFASAAVLPTINQIGMASTNGLTAAVAWIAAGLLVTTMIYGGRMRAWVDIGYTTPLMNHGDEPSGP